MTWRCLASGVAVTLGLLLHACGPAGAGTATLLRFEVDPTFGTEEELARRLGVLEVLFDAEGGFVELTSEVAAAAGLRIVDPDGDGDSELLREIPVGRERLPRVRIEPGHNLNRSLAIRVRGLDALNAVVVVGGRPPTRLFEEGRENETVVSLHPVRSQRPPHIVAVTPDRLVPGFLLTALAFYSSAPLALASLSGRVRMEAQGTPNPRPISGHLGGPFFCAFGVQMWLYEPDPCQLAPGGFTPLDLIFSSGIQGEDGAALDLGGRDEMRFTRDLGLAGIGDCRGQVSSETSCLGYVGRTGEIPTIEVECDPATGLFGPDPCGIGPTGCLDSTDVHVWLDRVSDWCPFTDETVGVSCVDPAPWPCEIQSDCGDPLVNCNNKQCKPFDCADDCQSDPSLICYDRRECLPRFGGCAEDCSVLGGCPKFEQRCSQQAAGGSFACLE